MSRVTIKKIVKVHLERSGNASWGFQIVGGTEFGEALRIGQVTPGTMADQAGLRLGDNLLEIKGEIVSEKSHADAKDLIVGSGNVLDIVIDRSADPSDTDKSGVMDEASPPTLPQPSAAPAESNVREHADFSTTHSNSSAHVQQQQQQTQNFQTENVAPPKPALPFVNPPALSTHQLFSAPLQSPETEFFTPKSWSAFKNAPGGAASSYSSNSYNYKSRQAVDGQTTTTQASNYQTNQQNTGSPLASPRPQPPPKPTTLPINVEVQQKSQQGASEPQQAGPLTPEMGVVHAKPAVPPKPMSPVEKPVSPAAPPQPPPRQVHPHNPPEQPRFENKAPKVLPRYPKKPQMTAMDYMKQQGGLFGTDPQFLAKLDAPPGYLNSDTLRMILKEDAQKGVKPHKVEDDDSSFGRPSSHRPSGFYSDAQSYSFKRLEQSLSSVHQGPGI